MGVRFPSLAISANQASQLASATETPIITTAPFNLSLDFQAILIMGMYMFVPGTGATSVTFRLKRGALLTSPQVTQWTLPVTAAVTTYTSFQYTDIPGAVAGIQYTFSGQQTGASAVASTNDSSMILLAL